MFEDKITIYHFNSNDIVTRLVFNDVYFKSNKMTNSNNKGVVKASSGIIVIPTDEKLNISLGDYVIRGVVNDAFNIKNLINKYQVFKVDSIADNRRGFNKHYKLSVAE